ncbi:hypothetical protein MPLDJ20_110151 [Mesorhizobium plurifarium]|uniref:Uncharacterized protein n=1 Tax=Mesorhizobium plurifarium TaxID=69974 RepID=A0A090DTP1_MESPL|nr:hypothetical protein MPLDJ20_110151 [Mesorhizobium plurifarium]
MSAAAHLGSQKGKWLASIEASQSGSRMVGCRFPPQVATCFDERPALSWMMKCSGAADVLFAKVSYRDTLIAGPIGRQQLLTFEPPATWDCMKPLAERPDRQWVSAGLMRLARRTSVALYSVGHNANVPCTPCSCPPRCMA